MKYFVDPDVICPFYRMELRQKICCDGPEDGVTLHIAFASSARMRRFMRENCDTFQWLRCPVAETLNRIWLEKRE